jgi:hypothetical protein
MDDHNEAWILEASGQEGHSIRKESWKKTLQTNLQLWIQEFETRDPAGQAYTCDDPDLYSFYEELCILRGEFRKSARRTHDTFVRFSETLSEFEKAIRSVTARVMEEKSRESEASLHLRSDVCLPLVEMFERLKRIEQKLAVPPTTGFFTARRTWKKAWTTLQEGFAILRDYFREFLEKEGIRGIKTVGRPFDPSLMVAVDLLETNAFEQDTVIEELSGGYFYRDRILKLAEVRVAKRKGD